MRYWVGQLVSVAFAQVITWCRKLSAWVRTEVHRLSYYPVQVFFVSALVIATVLYVHEAHRRAWPFTLEQFGHWIDVHAVSAATALVAGFLLIHLTSWLTQRQLPSERRLRLSWFELLGAAALVLFSGGHMALQVQADHGCIDPVNITSNTNWTTDQCHGDVTISNGATLTISGGVVADLLSLTLGNGVTNGFITALGDTGTGEGVTINVDEDVEVMTGSSILADGRGYAGGTDSVNGGGPGGGLAPGGAGTAGGGGYGGNGDAGESGGGAGGSAYGSLTNPTDLGSGGGGGSAGCCGSAGGNGGGAIIITSEGTVTINGTIGANGNNASNTCCTPGGGGSGGTINITADVLEGSGTVRANGGVGGCSSFGCSSGGSGAGGRIRLNYTTSTASLTIQAFGALSDNPVSKRGGAGTILTTDLLRIANNYSVTTIVSPVTPLSGQTLTVPEIEIKDRAYVVASSSTSLTADDTEISTNAILDLSAGTELAGGDTVVSDNTTVNILGTDTLWSGGTLTVQTNTNTINVAKDITTPPTFTGITIGTGTLQHAAHTSTHIYSLILHSTGSVAISGTISLVGRGYEGGVDASRNGKGPGGAVGPSGGNCGAGAGYAGSGGTPTSPGTGTAGTWYGTVTTPSELGSGGAYSSGGSCSANPGSAGGGAVKITALGTTDITGSISVNAATPTSGGGGSGGSIWLEAGTFTGNGTLTATGATPASGGTTGGGGSGGRIHLAYTASTATYTMQAFGGKTGTTRGAAGTISTTDKLTIANNSSSTSLSPATTLSGTFSYPATDIKDAANVLLATGASLSGGTTLASNNVKVTLGADDSTWSGGALTIETGTNTINARPAGVKPTFTSISITSGTLQHDANTTTDTNHLILRATGNLTVGAAVTVTSAGFAGGALSTAGSGTGPGQGSASSHGGGAGHGGNGGNGSGGSGGAGGAAYGSSLAPITLGSGGGGGTTSAGGAGGGAVEFIAGDTLAINAAITATGGNGGASCCGYGGGGSGGSILLIAPTITGSGNLTANGGSGGSTSGGCGAGGRIARHYTTSSYSGTVSAVRGGGACTNGEHGTTTTVGTVTELVLTGISSPRSAGVTSSVVVEARDASNNRNYSYTKAVTFTSTDGQADLPGDYTFTLADQGQATVPGVVLKTAGTQTVTADQTDDGSVDGTHANITVTPGSATVLNVGGISDPLTAGGSSDVVVTARDAYNNTATGYTGTITFTSSDSGATLPSNYTFTGGDAGTRTFSDGVILTTAGEQSVTATDTITSGITGTQTNITILAAAAESLEVSGIPSPTTAGVAGSVVVTARDPFNNIDTNYTGTVTFTSSDGAADLPSTYTFTGGDAGQRTFTNQVVLKTVGIRSVTATDTGTSSVTGTQASIEVVHGPAVVYILTPTVATVDAGTLFSATLMVKDAYNNIATEYTGTTTFTSTDSGATLPANYTFTGVDDGEHTFTDGFALVTEGNQTITATDTGNSSLTATSGSITVHAVSTGGTTGGGQSGSGGSETGGTGGGTGSTGDQPGGGTSTRNPDPAASPAVSPTPTVSPGSGDQPAGGEQGGSTSGERESNSGGEAEDEPSFLVTMHEFYRYVTERVGVAWLEFITLIMGVGTMLTGISLVPSALGVGTAASGTSLTGPGLAGGGITLAESLLFLFGWPPKRRWGIVRSVKDNEPVKGAVVELLDQQTQKPFRRTLTNAKGEYGFLVHKPGRYLLSVVHPSYRLYQEELTITDTAQRVAKDVFLQLVGQYAAHGNIVRQQAFILTTMHYLLLVVGTLFALLLLVGSVSTVTVLLLIPYILSWFFTLRNRGFRKNAYAAI